MELDDDILTRLIHGDITCWTIEDVLLYGRAVQALATDTLYTEMVSSCQCLTKTPEPQFHDRSCRYRILHEVQAMVQERRKANDPHAVGHGSFFQEYLRNGKN